MPAYTSVLGLYKPGGGSTGAITPDEPLDIDKINGNFDLIDAAVGFGRWTTATRPIRPFVNQSGYNSTLDIFERWSGTQWSSLMPAYLDPSLNYTKAQLNAGALDSRYFTQASLLGASPLDSKYATKASEVQATMTGTVVSGWTLNRFIIHKTNHVVTVDLSVNRNGSSLGPSPSGNISNTKIGNIGPWKPNMTWSGLAPGPGGATTSCAIDFNGDLYLCALPPNFTLVNGNEVTAGGSWSTDS